jgi:hypothetical protein
MARYYLKWNYRWACKGQLLQLKEHLWLKRKRLKQKVFGKHVVAVTNTVAVAVPIVGNKTSKGHGKFLTYLL